MRDRICKFAGRIFCQTMPGMTILGTSEKAGNEWCMIEEIGAI